MTLAMLALRVWQTGLLLRQHADAKALSALDVDLVNDEISVQYVDDNGYERSLRFDSFLYELALRASQVPPEVAEAGRHDRAGDVIVIGGLIEHLREKVYLAVDRFVDQLDDAILEATGPPNASPSSTSGTTSTRWTARWEAVAFSRGSRRS